MDFKIPTQIQLNPKAHNTILNAQEALQKHQPSRAARLLQDARINDDQGQVAHDLILATTLSHCNMPAKALEVVSDTLKRNDLNKEQILVCQLWEGEMLNILGKPKKALDVMHQCMQDCATLGSRRLAAKALLGESVAYSNIGNQHAALVPLEKLESFSADTKYAQIRSSVYAQHSICQLRLGDIVEALNWAEKAIDVADSNDSLGQAEGYRQIGIVRGIQYRFFESLEAHRKALNIFQELSYVPGQILEYLSLSQLYLNMADVGLAEHFCKKAQSSAAEGDNDSLGIDMFAALGMLSLAKGNFSEAASAFSRQRELAADMELDRCRAESQRNLGQVMALQGNVRGAFESWRIALQGVRQIQDKMTELDISLDLLQLKPFLTPNNQKVLQGLNLNIDTARKPKTNHPGIEAKLHFIDAGFEYADADKYSEAANSLLEDSLQTLTQYGLYLDAIKQLYLFGMLFKDVAFAEVSSACLMKSLQIAEAHGFQEFGKAILETVGTLDESGERLVLEFSMDKAAIRELGNTQKYSSNGRAIHTSLIGDCLGMVDLKNEIQRFAPTDLSVLILGQSGTGKELVAQQLHQQSHRAAQPFVAINCTTLPAGVIDSELFGAKKGAYTGLTKDRVGLFREADGGTVFLDEIGDLPVELQTKLLRFLQDRCVRPLGADKAYTVNVRIVAATNANIKKAMDGGQFREDLYYRLSDVVMQIPPLSERGNDILLIADGLLQRNSYARKKGITGLSKTASELLLRHPWRGNVRELEKAIKSAVVRASATKLLAEDFKLDTLTDIPDSKTAPENAKQESSLPLRDELMFSKIKDALLASNGNQSEAARILGIHRNSLRNWLKRMDRNPLE